MLLLRCPYFLLLSKEYEYENILYRYYFPFFPTNPQKLTVSKQREQVRHSSIRAVRAQAKVRIRGVDPGCLHLQLAGSQ